MYNFDMAQQQRKPISDPATELTSPSEICAMPCSILVLREAPRNIRYMQSDHDLLTLDAAPALLLSETACCTRRMSIEYHAP